MAPVFLAQYFRHARKPSPIVKLNSHHDVPRLMGERQRSRRVQLQEGKVEASRLAFRKCLLHYLRHVNTEKMLPILAAFIAKAKVVKVRDDFSTDICGHYVEC